MVGRAHSVRPRGALSLAQGAATVYYRKMQFQRNLGLAATLALCALLAACSGDSSGDNRSGTGGTGAGAGSGGHAGITGGGGTGGATGTGGNGTGGNGTGGNGTGGTVGGCAPVLCPDLNQYGCGDCVDNDGDGLTDDQDPECLGPCDDTEGPILLTGTPGETGNQCHADCYFDRGNGSGSGECQWHRECDPLNPKDGCTSPPSPSVETNICLAPQPAGCEESCGVLTPNGCDCFGCCTFPELAGGYVFLGSFEGNEGTCTLADINDPALCRPCTPAGNCLNTCERCELCLGKTEIPADCFPGSGGSNGTGGSGGMVGNGGTGGSGNLRCDPGIQACGLPGDPPCPAGGFCLTGCCILVQ